MARIALVEPTTGAVKQQNAVAGMTTGRGICFDGVGFWCIDETSATTWDICYVTHDTNTVVRAFGWPFTVVLTGFETLAGVNAITTDGLDLYVAYRIEYSDPGPPVTTTYVEYLSRWDKDGNLKWDKKFILQGLIASYEDLTWNGLKIVAAIGTTSPGIKYIDITDEKTFDVTLGFTPSGIAFDGLNYHMQPSGVNQLRLVSPNGVVLGTNLTLANAGGGLCYGHPDMDESALSDFMNGEWIAALYA